MTVLPLYHSQFCWCQHYALHNHLNSFDIVESPLCGCRAYETVDHILFYCPNNSINRHHLVFNLRQCGFVETFENRIIIATTRSAVTIKQIHSLIKANDLGLYCIIRRRCECVVSIDQTDNTYFCATRDRSYQSGTGFSCHFVIHILPLN